VLIQTVMSFKTCHPLRVFLIILLIMAVTSPSNGQRTKSSLRAGEQVKAERGLRDNRYFFYFINSSITNFGSEEERELFTRAIRHDILGQLLYMRFQFSEAYREIRKSQKIMIDLYRITLNRDIGTTRKLLNEFAPKVIHAADRRARSYLWLGYRDMKNAGTNMVMGDNYYETLYSMRLYQYVKSIKLAKEGRRYAFLALLEVNTPQEQKVPFPNLKYEEIEKGIASIANEENREYYLKLHMDNFYRVKDGRTHYDRVWENPELSSMEEYKEYFMKPDHIR